MANKNIKKDVRESYGRISQKSASCCSNGDICCHDLVTLGNLPTGTGAAYLREQLNSIPQGADLGLGCGNPTALASLREGETVVDLGSGGGIDCFLASKLVGSAGRVIGVDMTPEMIERARANAKKGDFANVEFRIGEIEQLPVDDNSADCVISNCVINLSPDKQRVFCESFSILKPGGRLMVSDIVLIRELPKAVRDSVEAYVSCIAGAEMKERYLARIQTAGFTDVEILEEVIFPVVKSENGLSIAKAAGKPSTDESEIADHIAVVSSIRVSARRPE